MAITLITGLASAIGYGLSLEVFAFSWAYFALGAGLSLVSRALAPKLDMGSQMGGRSVTTREAAHSRKIVYGRARIGGNIVYLESTGSDNKHLWLVIAVAGHEIDGYESVWFNDEKVWDGGVYQSGWASSGSTSTSPYVYIGFHNGDQTSVDSALNAVSTKWTANHILLDTAYMVVKLTYDQDRFAQGLPNISTIIRGKKVLHTAQVSAGNFYVGEKYKITEVGNTNFVPIGASANTVGIEFIATNVGSGSGKANSIDWSDNPALCVYDYLRDTKYGLGETAANILTASVTTAKGVCDETVSLAAGGTQKRYTINGVVDTANSIKSNIEQMLGSMIGRLVYSGGQFEIHAGAYVAPAFTVDESVAVGEITVQTKQSRRSAYNGVKGVFLSEDDNYILADYPAQISSSYATADGDPIYLDMALPFTTNNIRAQRIAKLALFRSRQQEAITIPCNLSALRFKVGENINVTNARLGYSNKIFEVVGYSMAFSNDGQIVVNVDAIETASSIWDWTTSDEEVFLGGGEVDLYDGSFAAAPTSINVTSDSFLSDDGTFNSQFNVAWTNADDAFTEHYVVEWKLASVSNYFSQTTKSTPFSIVNLVNNATYNVRVKAVNEIGVSSAYLSATPTSAIDATAPSLPSSITATAGYKSISLAWTYPPQKDFNNIEIWRSATPTGTYLEVSNVAGGFGAKAEHLDGGLGDAQSYSYKFKSVDLTGNKTSTTDFNNQTAVTQTTNAEAVDGINTAVVYAYRRSSTTLGATVKPTIDRTWTFSLGTFNNNDLGNSFTGGMPSGTDEIYVCNAVAKSINTTDAVVAADWSPPQLLAAGGADGYNTAVVYGYRRSATALTTQKPDETRTWTFSLASFNDNDLGNGFFAEIPSGTDNLYACTAIARSQSGTDSVAGTSDWSSPEFLSGLGDTGETGARNASGYLYYSVSQAGQPTKPIATGYNFATGAFTFTGSTGTNWSRTIPEATGGDQQFWATSYLVSESEYGTIGSIVFSPPFSSIHFDGLVTFTNLNNALATPGGNVTTIDGGLIRTNSIVVNKLSGDVTEVYPLMLYLNTVLSTTETVIALWSLPAPALSISKRQKLAFNAKIHLKNTNNSTPATNIISFDIQKKSKGVNAQSVGTVTLVSFSNYQGLISVPGNQLHIVDGVGGIGDSATPSSSNNVLGVYYNATANKTYINYGAGTNPFATNDTCYYSDSKFTSAGTWVTPSDGFTYAALVPEGSGSTRDINIPIELFFGSTTTATDFRIQAEMLSDIVSGEVFTVRYVRGVMENIA